MDTAVMQVRNAWLSASVKTDNAIVITRMTRTKDDFLTDTVWNYIKNNVLSRGFCVDLRLLSSETYRMFL